MELKKIWAIIKRRKWIIIIVFLAMSFTSVIGSLLMFPAYQSTAKLIIGGPSDSFGAFMSQIGITQKTTASSDPSDQKMETKKSLAVSTQILEMVINNLQLRNKHGELMKPDDLTNKQLFSITPRPFIEIDQYEKSSLLEIRAESPDPEEAQLLVMTLSDIFLDKTLDWVRDEFSQVGSFIDKQNKDARSDYFDALKTMVKYKVGQQTMDLKGESQSLLQRIEDLSKDLRTSTIKRHSLEASIKETTGQMKKMNIYQEFSKEYKENPELSHLREDINKLIVSFEEKRVEYTEAHPEVEKLRIKLDKSKDLLNGEVEKTFSKEVIGLNPNYTELVKKLIDDQIELETTRAQEKIIPGYIKDYEKKILKLPQKEFELTKLQANIDATGSLYKSMLEYEQKVGVAKAMTLADIRMIDPPVKPDTPFSPNKKLNVLIGMFLGLFFGSGLALVVEFVDNTIKETDDLRDYNFTLLGLIPAFTGRAAVVTKVDANDPVYEAYRSVISNSQLVKPAAPIKRLLVTSVGPREGKTTTVANMGILFAKEGKKTILLDADFRRARLHNMFGLSNERGVIDVLSGRMDVESVINRTGVENLSVIASGPAPLDPGQILKSPKMKEMIESLVSTFDIILIDSAPLSIKNDAVFMMDYMEDMLMVVRKDVTEHQSIQRVNELLQNAKISVLGVVFNQG